MLSLILITVIILLIIVQFYKSWIRPHSFWKRKGVLEAKSSVIFGENWKFIIEQENFFDCVHRLYNQFPDAKYSGLYQFNTPILLVRDIDLIKKITIQDFDHFVDHRKWLPETTDKMWNENLFMLEGEQWKEMRNFLSPAFTGRKMRAMFVLMDTAAEKLIKYFNDMNKDAFEYDFKDIFHRYTCDVIATAGFGIEVDSLKQPNNEFYYQAKKLGNFTGIRKWLFFISFFLPKSIMKFLDIQFYEKETHNFFINLVKETMQERELKGIIRPDMIHLMMEAKKGQIDYFEKDDVNDTNFATQNINSSESKPRKNLPEMTDLYITAQVMLFILGGLDTIAIVMRFMAYELAINPDIQDKLRAEIRETVANTGGNITYEAIKGMKYMDMVVTELLRRWPPGFLLDRVCTKPYTLPPAAPGDKELTLDVGTFLWMPVVGIHLNPKYYTNPLKFDPERFSDENKDKINPNTYMPFGLGPRFCIGNRFALLETKVIFFHILNSYEIVPGPKSSIPIKIVGDTFNLEGDNFIFELRRLK